MKKGSSQPMQLGANFNLADFGFFQRGGVKEVALFVSREVIGRAEKGSLMSVTHLEYVCHTKVCSDGLAIAAMTDAEYPTRVAFVMLQDALDIFRKQVSGWESYTSEQSSSVSGFDDLIQKYLNKPEDKITKIQSELDNVKGIMMKNIEDLLDRGEKLESLVEKSEDLSMSSKTFMKSSEQLNSCCIIL